METVVYFILFDCSCSIYFRLFLFRCVKFEESNDLSQLIFGTVSVIPAKDALPIEVNLVSRKYVILVLFLSTQHL